MVNIVVKSTTEICIVLDTISIRIIDATISVRIPRNGLFIAAIIRPGLNIITRRQIFADKSRE
ncbi:MAG: hypothetical protein QGE96_02980 [Candidatus Poseidoniia archaeon]|nr:hypothetical protein [Candidatus Poseidoniia archaeon]